MTLWARAKSKRNGQMQSGSRDAIAADANPVQNKPDHDAEQVLIAYASSSS
jgi:hypothetical protein